MFFGLFPTVLTTPAMQTFVHPGQIYTYQKMQQDLRQLSVAYPDLVHVVVIGHTFYHRNIYAVSVGHGDASIVINASHHAREWITTRLVMNMMHSYCTGYQNKLSIQGYPIHSILDTEAIWFIPMVNPDGVTLQQFGARAYPPDVQRRVIHWNNGSRDFSQWKANAQGIDLNRQYDADWRRINNSPPHPASKLYKGAKPFEAAEVLAIKRFLERIQPTYVVSYHASGNVIFSDGHRKNRDSVARDLSELTHYRVVSMAKSYGGLTDWWDKHPNKVAITIEVGPFYGENEVPLKYIARISQENKSVGLYLASRRAHERRLKTSRVTRGK